MSKRLGQIEARITEAYAELAELDALIATEQAAEKQSRLDSIKDVGAASYRFGTGAQAHRQKWKKAADDREVLLEELDALAVARSTEKANEAAEALGAAVKGLRPHRKNLERLYAEAGTLLEQVAEVWLQVKDEMESFDGKIAAGHGLADAAATTDPNAHGVWNEVVFSLGDLGPLPTNLAYFAETIIAAGLDPDHAYEYRINTMRTKVVPDLRPYNVPASFSGSHLAKRGGSDFGDRIAAIAIANEPKPEPAPPSAEQLANIAAREAEEERRFQARRAHQVAHGKYVDDEPRFAPTPPAVDPLADPRSPGGFDPATERLARELAGSQTQ